MDLLRRLNQALGHRYEFAGELGRGGMAVVYRARDAKHDRQVAIKVLRPELSASLGTDRFLREIRIAAALQHPNIVPLYDSGERDGVLYYVMPFVEGETVRDRLRREKQLSIHDALLIARQVADALSYAHSQGLVHRDIKPENILLTENHALVADFGVARAISQAAGSELTESGIAIGTPAYMSPEQATGRGDLDHRSDIYALGCVLYEMLAGEPPFTGATAQSIIARHVSERPPSLRVVRPSVAVEVERAIAVALAKVPADRYATAHELVQALPEDAAASQPVLAPLVRRRRRKLLAAAGAALLLAAAVLGVRRLLRPALDPTLYVIASFHHREGAAPVLLDGDQCQWRLSHAFRHWEGLRVVEQFQLSDARRRRGTDELTSDDWVEVARGLGAGRLIRGEVAQFGDSVSVSASLFEVPRGGRLVQQASITLFPPVDNLPAKFHQLAARLLRLEVRSDALLYRSTRSIPALNALIEGRQAVEAGNLSAAQRAFLRAGELDPEFAEAHLWLAQVGAWSGRRPDDWRASAARAFEMRQRLSDPRDSLIVTPLHQLAQGAFSEACRGFRRAIAVDSTNVTAWLGLGECESRDPEVVRSNASPSGWAFRGSYHTAVRAYRHALALVPFLTAALYPRLELLLFTEGVRLRRGRAAAPDTTSFLARPHLEADSLTFVPYPAQALLAGRADSLDANLDRALARNRMMLRAIVEHWTAAYPRSAEAHAALARTLESFGDLVAGRTGEVSALAALRRSRELAPSPDAALDAALGELRIYVKTRAWARARAVAESLIATAGRQPTARHAEPLAAAAVLIGRPSAAGDMLARHAAAVRDAYHDPRMQALPLPLFEARQHLVAFGMLGEPADSLAAWRDRFDELLSGAVEPAGRTSTSARLLDDLVTLAYPALGLGPPVAPDSPNYLRVLQHHAASGDTAAVRELLGRLAALRETIQPGAIAIEAVLQEVTATLAVGDTARAVARLDRSLTALPTYSARFLWLIASAGSLNRALALRVRLALAQGDHATARVWGDALREMLRTAEPPVRDGFRDILNAFDGR